MSEFRAESTVERRGTAGRTVGTLFFAVFLAMGLAFTAFIAREFMRNAATYRWTQVECAILASGVEDKGGDSPYQPKVRYQYSWRGQDYSSDQIWRRSQSFSDYGKAQRVADSFPVDSKSLCFINPERLSEAVLRRGNLLIGLFILLPLLFVAVGGGGIYAMWARSKPSAPAPIQLRSKGPSTKRGSVVVFGFFALVGGIAAYFMLVRPAVRILNARDWTPVPCTVISSRVQSHRSDDGTTYKVDILYAYEVGGREFKCNRYDFIGGSSSGYDGKAKVVARYPPSSKCTCYVNPADPTDAVLHRGITPVMWFGGIPLLFLLIGVSGMLGAFQRDNRVRTDAGLSGPAVLKAKASPMAKALGGLFFSLFWNGIVAVFVFQAYTGWSKGKSGFDQWFLTLFLIPFVLIGIGMIAFTLHSFAGLFSPRVRLHLNSPVVRQGENAEVTWEFTGRTDRVRELHLQLEGCREEDEGTGKSRRTKRDVFYSADLGHFTNTADIRTGRATFSIPPEQPVSDGEGAQRVAWQFRLKAKVDFGADLSDEYPLEVVSGTIRPVTRNV